MPNEKTTAGVFLRGRGGGVDKSYVFSSGCFGIDWRIQRAESVCHHHQFVDTIVHTHTASLVSLQSQRAVINY